MNISRPQVVILADAPGALIELCGVSLLERLLRALVRLGLCEGLILSRTRAEITAHLAPRSWARAGFSFTVRERDPDAPLAGEVAASTRGFERVLLLDASILRDARLLRALIETDSTALLIDSIPSTPEQESSMLGAAQLKSEWLASLEPNSPLWNELRRAATTGAIATVDVATQSTYVIDLRRHLRPFWIPAPESPKQKQAAERLLLDSAQNGTLDLPAKIHAPIETWILARLCRTRITPNQITFFTALVSIAVTVLFGSGHLLAGTLLALVVGILDGLDGKQARLKVETTPLGRREHWVDYLLELSWWTALAHHFAVTGWRGTAYAFLLLLVVSDLIDRIAKEAVKRKTGRNLDDVAPIDRFVRLIGGRRNIYIWMFALGLALGVPEQAFHAFCAWGALTAVVHVVRAAMIGRERLPE